MVLQHLKYILVKYICFNMSYVLLFSNKEFEGLQNPPNIDSLTAVWVIKLP